jgi:hypothetical protein
MKSIFARAVPVVFGTVTAAFVAAGSGDAVAADRVVNLINKQPNNTVVAFTGGYGNVIGVHKFQKNRYSIFYADSVGTNQNLHSHTVMKNGNTSWTFFWAKDRRLQKAEDLQGNTIQLTHNTDGSISYTMGIREGHIFRTTSGKVAKSALPSGIADVSTPLAAGDPILTVPVQVNGCTGWPAKPHVVELNYNFGQGAQTTPIELTSKSGTRFNYRHVVRPLSGFRTAKATLTSLTTAFPKKGANACVVRAQLAAICAKTTGAAKEVCGTATAAIAPHCNNKSFGKLIQRSTGTTKAKVEAALPGNVRVTATTTHPDAYNSPQKVSVSGNYTWNTKGAPLVINLPCWNVFAADFRKTGTFDAHGGACKAPVQVGRAMSVAVPVDGNGDTVVDLQRDIRLIEKGCFNGTYENKYEVVLKDVVAGPAIETNHLQPSPYQETDLIKLNPVATGLKGSWTFTLKHKATPGGFHEGTVIVPLNLAPVIQK